MNCQNYQNITHSKYHVNVLLIWQSFKNKLYHFTALNTRSVFINDNKKQVMKHFQSH